MKILIDTCVALDVLDKREPFFDSSKNVLALAAQQKIEAYITSKSISDIYYLLHKHNHSIVDSKRVISTLLELVNVIDVNGIDIAKALASEMNDFEDAIIAESAKRHGIDYIATRNIKDFQLSPVSAVLPSQIK